MFENDKQVLENDVLVLHVLDEFDVKLTEKNLTEIVMTPGLVNYFGFQDSLKRLLEKGFIAVSQENDGTNSFGVTEDGHLALPSLLPLLSPALLNSYNQVISDCRERLTLEACVNAYPFTDANGNNAVRLYIRENGNKVVDLRIPVPDRKTAAEITDRWKGDAYGLLMEIVSLLSGD